MANNITMEGKKDITKAITKIRSHPHFLVFMSILVISVLSNSIMISYMGVFSFIDSLSNPEEYKIISHKYILNKQHEADRFCIIAQKQSQTLSSINTSDQLYIHYSNDCSSYYLLSNQSEKPDQSLQIAGKVVSIIESDPLSTLSFIWWQKSIQFIEILKSKK